jgi:CRISPR-associated protein Cas2
MWVIAMFDLPVDTPKAKADYVRFRTHLLKDGFAMMQYSVYMRHCATEENAKVHYQRVRSWLPPDGEVRLLTITDLQFGKMEVFLGARRKAPVAAPAQVEMF